MSMTGRWIDGMREQADKGDTAAQKTLRSAGLRDAPEDAEAMYREQMDDADDEDDDFDDDFFEFDDAF